MSKFASYKNREHNYAQPQFSGWEFSIESQTLKYDSHYWTLTLRTAAEEEFSPDKNKACMRTYQIY